MDDLCTIFPLPPKLQPVEPIDKRTLASCRRAVRRETAKAFKEAMKAVGFSSRQVARVLNQTPINIWHLTAPKGYNAQLDTMTDIARAMGKKLKITLEDL